MARQISKWMAILLSWLAFAVTFCSFVGLIVGWPVLRGAADENVGGVMASIISAVFVTAIVLGLTVLEYVQVKLGVTEDVSTRNIGRTGCLVIVVPSAFVAFFCTCAPLGLLSAVESTVRPEEKNWTDEIWIVAWGIGIAAAVAVQISVRRRRREAQQDVP